MVQVLVSASHRPPIVSQSLGPDATLGSLGSLGALGSLGELTELGLLGEDAAEFPSEACAIDIVVKAGAA